MILEGFKSQKWGGKTVKDCQISTLDFQCVTMSIDSRLKNLYFISGFVICTVKYTHTCALGTGFKLVSCKWGPQREAELCVYLGKKSRLLHWAVPNDPKLLAISQWMWIFLGRKKLNYASILGREACLRFSVGQCPMFQKYWRWANQGGSFSKRKGKTPGVHPPPPN